MPNTKRDSRGKLTGSQTGPDNLNWKGDKATLFTAHGRCRRLYPDPIFCEVCGKKAERHHKDDDPFNNERSNIQFLCRKHHVEVDGRTKRPEFRAAVSASSSLPKPNVVSQETRAKMSASQIKRFAKEKDDAI